MQDITFIGEPVSDSATFKKLPFVLQAFMLQQNGLIAYFGGLHIRGCCKEPAWHSLDAAWNGPQAFWKNYPKVKPTDIPFGQDAVGNQFLLRHNRVWFLDTETGQVQNLQVDFPRFVEGVERFPAQALDLTAIANFVNVGAALSPGELLAVFPPACIQTDGQRVQYTRMPADVRLNSLADLHRQISKLKPGQKITVRTDAPIYDELPMLPEEPTPAEGTETADAPESAGAAPEMPTAPETEAAERPAPEQPESLTPDADTDAQAPDPSTR